MSKVSVAQMVAGLFQSAAELGTIQELITHLPKIEQSDCKEAAIVAWRELSKQQNTLVNNCRDELRHLEAVERYHEHLTTLRSELMKSKDDEILMNMLGKWLQEIFTEQVENYIIDRRLVARNQKARQKQREAQKKGQTEANAQGGKKRVDD